MSHHNNDKDETLSEVNVIPLADLSLVLLIVLMIMSPMITQALIQVAAANAKQAESQQDAAPETPVIVSFEPNALKLNGTVMGSELEFASRLSQVMGTRRDKSVLFTAAPEVMHGKVVHVMDLIKRHGAGSLVMLKWGAA